MKKFQKKLTKTPSFFVYLIGGNKDIVNLSNGDISYNKYEYEIEMELI